MKIAKCRLYLIDKSSNKLLFKVMEVKQMEYNGRYSMIKMEPGLYDFTLYSHDPSLQLYGNAFYLIDSEFEIVNYMGHIGDGFFEVIPKRFGSSLGELRGLSNEYVACEFIDANIELVNDKLLNFMKCQPFSKEMVVCDIDETNTDLSCNNKYRYDCKFVPIEIDPECIEFPEYMTVGEFIDRIDKYGGKLVETTA